MVIRIDVTESTMAFPRTAIVKMANDRIDAEQHEADDQRHGEETEIKNHVSGLGHIGHQQRAGPCHGLSSPG